MIGWLLLAVGVENALALDLAQGYGLRAAAEGWPGGPVAEAIVMAGWLPQAPALVLIVLLFPTDRLPGRRWWLVVWMSVLGAALAEPGWVLNPLSGGEYAAGPNPYAVEGPLPDVLFVIGFTLTATALLTAFVGALVRFRRSIGVERQQLKWFALSTGVLVVTAAPALTFWEATPVVPLLAAVCLTVWPVTIGIAVLRYRLYGRAVGLPVTTPADTQDVVRRTVSAKLDIDPLNAPSGCIDHGHVPTVAVRRSHRAGKGASRGPAPPCRVCFGWRKEPQHRIR